MCGRYERRSDKQRIAEAFQTYVGLEELYLEPENDIAPGSIQPVILTNPDGERQIELMRWGFKLPDRLVFNARSEGIADAKFWKESFRKRRCIVPADSFFEWEKVKTARKPKYEFGVSGGGPFGMGGLWAPWKCPKTRKWEHTFAIMTGDANAVMQPVHDRQPTILEPRDYAEYLAEGDRPPVHLLRILPDDKLQSQLVEQDMISDQQVSLFDSV
jgi:putative SOS response-associated peptidase YedK